MMYSFNHPLRNNYKYIIAEGLYVPKMDVYLVRIIEQTHRGKYFGKNGSIFVNYGITLISTSFPAINFECSSPYIYVRGKSTELDNIPIVMNKELYNKFKKAICAYNEYFYFSRKKENEDLSNEIEIIE